MGRANLLDGGKEQWENNTVAPYGPLGRGTCHFRQISLTITSQIAKPDVSYWNA